LSVWQTPSGRSRRWVRRKDTNIPAPLYARLMIFTLLVALAGTLLWYGSRSLWDKLSRAAAAPESTAARENRLPAPTVAWQSDALASIENGIHEVQTGNITAAEVAMDRAASVIEAARVRLQKAPSDFFETASRSLDLALQGHQENSRLFEHVTATRVDLAQLRSAQGISSGQGIAPDTALNAAATSIAAPAGHATKGESGAAAGISGAKEVAIGAPREIAANHLLDPKTLGGDTINATLMPVTLEILLPPSSRLFVDDVRVQDLTLRGASQTLDGIHWKNVTFLSTRLRYEGGELDLQNVHFIGCTFGLSIDQRGARLANAIALGQTSLTIVD